VNLDWKRHRAAIVAAGTIAAVLLGVSMWWFAPSRKAAKLTREGISAGKEGDLYRASLLLFEAAKTDPDFFLARYNLGLALKALGNPEQALQEFYAAAAAQPKDPMTYFEIARLHAQAGRQESALAALERSIDLGFDDIPLLAKDQELEPVNNTQRFMDLWERWETRKHRQKPGASKK
jgi:tetratricopeptide (TPR) repeat protein